MNKNIKLSIIITLYNKKNYLKELFQSLSTHVYNKDIEFIFIDDGSTDGSSIILKKLELNFKFIYHSKNKGVSFSRNQGIKCSKGKYITFLDGDDYFDENYIINIIKTIDSTSANIIQSNLLLFNNENNLIDHYSNLPFNKIKTVNLNFDPQFIKLHAVSNIYKSSFIHDNKIFFDTNLTQFEDVKFLAQSYLKNNGEFLFNPKLIYYYRQDSENSLSKRNLEIQEMEYILEFYLYSLKTHKQDYIKLIILQSFQSFVKKLENSKIEFYDELKKYSNIDNLIEKISKMIGLDFINTYSSRITYDTKNYIISKIYNFKPYVTKYSIQTKFELLKNLESEYMNLKIGGYYIWQRLKTSIFGDILLVESNSSRTTEVVKANNTLIKQQQQLINLKEHHEVILFNFTRKDFNEKGIYDPKTYDIKDKLLKENIDFIEVNSSEEGCYSINASNLYQTRDLDLMLKKESGKDKYIFTEKEYFILKSIENKIINVFGQNIDLIQRILFFYNEIKLIHDYYSVCFKQIKPKLIITSASYLQHFMPIAKSLNIPVLDIQYAALTKYHVGYDVAKDYCFKPDQMALWGSYWNNNGLAVNSKNNFVFNTNNYSIHSKESNKIIFISQNIIGKFMEKQAKDFARNYKNMKVILIKHPYENLIDNSKELPNLSIEKGTLYEHIKNSTYVVGASSSGLYEAYRYGSKIIILNNFLNVFVQNELEKELFIYTDNLINEFPHIKTATVKKDAKLFEKNIPNIRNKILLRTKDIPKLNKYDELIIANYKELISKEIITSKSSLTKNILISIIIPIYNGGETLSKTILTLMQSKYFNNFEIIIINDGSTDDTKEIISKLKTRYSNIIIINNEIPSGGASIPRNQGISISTGKYIYFIDSGDFLYSNTLDLGLELMEQENLDVAKFSVFVKKKKDNLIYYADDLLIDDNQSRIPLFKLTFVHNHIYRTSIIKNNNILFENTKVGEDLLFNIQIYKNSKKIFSHSSPIIVYLKENENTLSTTINKSTINDSLNIYLNVRELISDFEALKIEELLIRHFLNDEEVHKIILENPKLLSLRNRVQFKYNSLPFDTDKYDIEVKRIIFDRTSAYITLDNKNEFGITLFSFIENRSEIIEPGINIILVDLVNYSNKFYFFSSIKHNLKIKSFKKYNHIEFNRKFEISTDNRSISIRFNKSKKPYFSLYPLINQDKVNIQIKFHGDVSNLKKYKYFFNGIRIYNLSELFELDDTNFVQLLKENGYKLKYRNFNKQIITSTNCFKVQLQKGLITISPFLMEKKDDFFISLIEKKIYIYKNQLIKQILTLKPGNNRFNFAIQTNNEKIKDEKSDYILYLSDRNILYFKNNIVIPTNIIVTEDLLKIEYSDGFILKSKINDISNITLNKKYLNSINHRLLFNGIPYYLKENNGTLNLKKEIFKITIVNISNKMFSNVEIPSQYNDDLYLNGEKLVSTKDILLDIEQTKLLRFTDSKHNLIPLQANISSFVYNNFRYTFRLDIENMIYEFKKEEIIQELFPIGELSANSSKFSLIVGTKVINNEFGFIKNSKIGPNKIKLNLQLDKISKAYDSNGYPYSFSSTINRKIKLNGQIYKVYPVEHGLTIRKENNS